uniref:Uncharacterized protein n=1 Tax=Oryza punctata TaxID=4537 RepID=A0A0E0KP65_ORYPU
MHPGCPPYSGQIEPPSAKDDELGRKSLEMEGLTRSLQEAKAENKCLQAELDKGSEAKAEIDRLKAEPAKEQG